MDEEADVEPPKPEEAIALTKELANATDSDDVTAEDVMVTSKVIHSLAKRGVAEKRRNQTQEEHTKEVKSIVVVSDLLIYSSLSEWHRCNL